MFEFHGWVVLRSTSGRSIWRDTGLFLPDDEKLLADLEILLQSRPTFTADHIRKHFTVNGLHAISLSGITNHRKDEVFELLEWIRRNGRRSYGVVLTRDAEDADRKYDYSSMFRVYRLSNGLVTELDSFIEIPAAPPPLPGEWEEA